MILRKIIIIIILAAVAVGIYAIGKNIDATMPGNPQIPRQSGIPTNTNAPGLPGEQVFCTMDAKMCPDGSYVGRVPPRCEYAMCPAGTASQPVTVTAKINQRAEAFGVRITPLEILEDSRCPSGVQCIQAGTVRIRARLESGSGTSMQEFGMNVPITTEVEQVVMTDVRPSPIAGRQVQPGEYTFVFTVNKR